MGIPESQLETWSHQGAVTTAKDTLWNLHLIKKSTHIKKTRKEAKRRAKKRR